MTKPAPEANFASQTIWTGDNLPVMRGMNSATVDLIYLDPPFNSNVDYAAPIGSQAAGAEFKDTWGLTDIDLAWCDLIERDHPALHKLLHAVKAIHGDSMMSYLIYMTVRLQEMSRLLKPTGSIYLHCDPTAGHYLKLVMDEVFGKSNFRNEIVWRIGWVSGYKTQKHGWIRNHDTILYYVKTGAAAKRFNKRYIPYPEGYTRRDGSAPTGKGIPIEDTWNCQAGDVLDSIMIKSFSKEKVGYPTQKPLALLRRIIAASSDPGDMVVDPFCGCATACIASEMEGREWVGIDISPKAADLVKLRMEREMPLETWQGTHRTDIPVRSDLGDLPPAGATDNREIMYERQAELCAGCGIHFPLRNLTVDHVVPASRGGSDHISNLQLLCGACNSMKGDRPMEYLARRLSELGLIDDAQQRKLAVTRARSL